MSQDELSTRGNPLAGWPESRLTRRQMIQRLGILGLALPSAAALLEACGPGGATQQATQPTKDLTGDLTIWGWGASLDALKLVDADFSAAYPKITLKYVVRPPADTYRNIQLAITAGAGAPDISVIEDSHISQYVQLGALADITDWVKPYVPKIVTYKWTWISKSNRYYAMPWDPGPVAVFYRRDIFQKAGVDPASIQTWEDFYQAATTIKQKTGSFMWQQAKARNDGRLFETLLWQQGTGYIDPKGNVILDKDPKVQQTLEFIGRFWKDNLAADQEPWTDPWYKSQSNGSAATVIDAVWMGTFFKSFIAPKAAGSWGVFMLPVWQAGGSRASNDGGSVLGIFEQSSQKLAAWAYVQFHLGRDQSQLQIYQKTDIFPSLKSSFQDPFFQEGDPYFGDQKVRSMFADIAAKIPDAGIYSKDYQQMSSLTTPEIQKYALGKQSAQQALANAAGLIRERTHRS
jgi:ABC-type glycerol-3-phosphate transport system substrate-binding protein